MILDMIGEVVEWTAKVVASAIAVAVIGFGVALGVTSGFLIAQRLLINLFF